MALNLAASLLHLSMDTYGLAPLSAHDLSHRMMQMVTEEDYSRYRNFLAFMVPKYHLYFSSQPNLSLERVGMASITGNEQSADVAPLIAHRDYYIRLLDEEIDHHIDASLALAHRDDWYNEKDSSSGISLYMNSIAHMNEQKTVRSLFSQAASKLTTAELDYLIERTRNVDETTADYNRNLLRP